MFLKAVCCRSVKRRLLMGNDKGDQILFVSVSVIKDGRKYLITKNGSNKRECLEDLLTKHFKCKRTCTYAESTCTFNRHTCTYQNISYAESICTLNRHTRTYQNISYAKSTYLPIIVFVLYVCVFVCFVCLCVCLFCMVFYAAFNNCSVILQPVLGSLPVLLVHLS